MPEKTHPKRKSTDVDADLTRLLIGKDLVTPQEIDQCLRKQKELAQKGDPRNLTQILLAMNAVTPNQMARIRQTLEDTKGRQIPGYQLLAKIGSGSMATVFKARQVSLNRTVAIKVLPKRLSADAEYVERLYREGEAAAKLNHPNIVQAIDIGEAGGYHYFVMEFVEGHTIHDELAGGKIFSEAEALHVAIQIARALEHAHEHGLIHRDVKPKNIMITTDGVAKLADMGLARGVADTAAARAEAGLLFGTPYYISPEQIVGKQNIDFRADIYSLGATLYHMVTGQVPFQAPDAKGVMMKHLKQKLTPPDRLNIDLSAGLCKVIQKMMTKDRDKRYQTTRQLRQDLESIDFLLEVDSPEAPARHPLEIDPTPATWVEDEKAGKQARPPSQDRLSAAAPSARPGPGKPAAPTTPRPKTTDTMTLILALLLAVSILLNILLFIIR